jgi:hypothetical protein
MENLLLIAMFVVLIIYIILDKKQGESFKNVNTSIHNNYKDFVSNSGPPWIQTTETMDEIEYILLEIIKLINKETQKHFFIGNIDNITKNKLEDNTTHYLIDLFLFEKTEDFTIRIIIDFTIDKNNNVIVNTINKSNANYYNFSSIENTDIPFEKCITDKGNQTEKLNIKGFNDITLHYSLYNNTNAKEIPTPPEFNKDILPLMIQKDTIYQKIVKHNEQKKKLCNKTKKCWDCSSVLTRNPKYCSCSSINNFKQEKETLLEQPQFNPSIHKLSSNKTDNHWLFDPTRLEVNHNY